MSKYPDWQRKEEDKLRNRLFELVGHPFEIPEVVEASIRVAADYTIDIEMGGGHASGAFEMVLRVFTKWAGEKLFRENP